ncbi:GNAT family N-acetyltransferase [Microbacterium marinilacus]|uniref:GNAT family N-acetyltransferase n=1 Tax=Microbacterium marinilacus TaxID=415209 RepID=A0ABP7B160_9MICO|nr:GNAT family N-acetyltransferase [Microbacterium marinilacus]MBY0688690.1 GNAT family N-acetyltransferase [Microbacterium marinilacus]
MSFTIHRPVADDWEAFRDLRLRMLRDTPIAYGETLKQALRLDDDEWRSRALRAVQSGNTAAVAVAQDGAWVGIMRGYVSQRRGPMLVGVFVDPGARGAGAGVADALLDVVVEWARGEGNALRLDVHADNPRAIAFYRRRGFEDTGRRIPYELPPFGEELEMELRL